MEKYFDNAVYEKIEQLKDKNRWMQEKCLSMTFSIVPIIDFSQPL